jgi:tetratricopeptide (TPR) repeat protein
VGVFWGNVDLAILNEDQSKLSDAQRYLRIAKTNALIRWGDDTVDSSQPKKGMEFGQLHLHLATIHQRLQQFEVARDEFENGLAHLLGSLGETNTDYIVWLGAYERLLRANGEAAAAGKTTRRALTLAKSVFGNDHPRVAELYSDMAEQQRAEADRPGAIASAKEALRIFDKTRGQTNSNSLKTRQLLADLEKPSAETH